MFRKRQIMGMMIAFLLFGNALAASTNDIILTEDTFSSTQNSESTDTIISESILLPIQHIGSGGNIIERAHEVSTCGNNSVEFSEACDKNNFSGKTCATYGKNAGTLSCSADCKTINTSACFNASVVTPTPAPTSGGSGGGGGYNPIIWATPTTLIGTISNATHPDDIGTQDTKESEKSLTTGSLLHSATLTPSDAWLKNSLSPWLENDSTIFSNNTSGLSADLISSGILPFEEWRKQQNIDALPSSEAEKNTVAQSYITYVQNELEKKKISNPVQIASMIDGKLNPERVFGESAFWKDNDESILERGKNTLQTFHAAAMNEGGACQYYWIWLLFAFLLGMLAEYIIYILFSKKYEK